MDNRQWLEVFMAIGRGLRAGITEFLAREDGMVPLGRGAGGDKTFPVDKWAEDIIVGELEKVRAAGESFTLVSEELGIRSYGGGDRTVLVDPIDGSNNAKSGVPFFSTSLALVEGDRLSGLAAGYVVNLAAGDEFWATRGGGAFRNGRPLRTASSDDVTIVAYEASSPSLDIPRILPLLRMAKRTRCFGSTALDLSYLASGSLSVLVTATASRAFDYAAGMIILEEAGGCIADFSGRPIDSVRAGLDRTVPLVAAKNRAALDRAVDLLRAF